jgi:hypothetical protein
VFILPPLEIKKIVYTPANPVQNIQGQKKDIALTIYVSQAFFIKTLKKKTSILLDRHLNPPKTGNLKTIRYKNYVCNITIS